MGFLVLRVFVALVAVFGATLDGMWDLSSLTRDRTHAPCSGSTES